MVEFIRANLAFLHRFAEVPRISTVLQHRFLKLSGCAGDCVGQLVPVLRGELASASGLRKHHAHRAERFRVTARDSVQITCRFGQLVEALYSVRGKLCGHVADIADAVNSLVGVCLSAGRERVNRTRIQSSEVQRAFELVRRIGCFDNVSGKITDGVHSHTDTRGNKTANGTGDYTELTEPAGRLASRLVNVTQRSISLTCRLFDLTATRFNILNASVPIAGINLGV